jgi:hypothetical protein
MRSLRSLLVALAMAGALALTAAFTGGPEAPVTKVSKPFAGAKVNGGTVTMVTDAGKITLTLSDEVQDPKTPDAHWLVVDGKGKTYLLDRLTLKGDKFSKAITVPSYVRDVVKVQIYCAWAEANLGEAAF